MKSTLAIIALIALPVTTFAESLSCETLGVFAETVMSARQGGTPMGNVFRMAEGFKNDLIPLSLHKSFSALARTIITDAYSSPKYHTYEMQKGESVEFGNKVMLACVKEIE